MGICASQAKGDDIVPARQSGELPGEMPNGGTSAPAEEPSEPSNPSPRSPPAALSQINLSLGPNLTPPTAEAIAAIDAAVAADAAEALRDLLNEHPSAISTVPWGGEGSLLHAAAGNGCGHALIRVLQEFGADGALPDDDAQTALHVAVANGNAPAADALTSWPRLGAPCPELTLVDKYKMTPFHLACEGGDAELVKLLLGRLRQAGARESLINDLRRGSANFIAQRHNHADILKLLQSERDSVISSLGQRSSNVGSITGGLLGSPRPNAVAEEPSTMAESTASTASRPWEEESMSASVTTTPEPSAMGPEPSLKEVIEAR